MLLGMTATFYHFTHARFGRAALWGLLVGLTKTNGFLLSIPLAMLAVSGPTTRARRAEPSDRADEDGARWSIVKAISAAPSRSFPRGSPASDRCKDRSARRARSVRWTKTPR